MDSEYDFLSPYLRRLRRIASVLAVGGAVLAGVVSMALVVGLPLLPRSNMDAAISLFKNSPVTAPSLNTPQEAANTAAPMPAGSVGAVPGAGSDSDNPPTVANVSVETATSLEKTPLPQGGLSRLKLDESTPERAGSQSVLSPAQPSRDPVVSSVKLPSGPSPQSAGPRLTAGRPKAELPANAAKRAPDRTTPEPARARPEPFSIQEFLASHP